MADQERKTDDGKEQKRRLALYSFVDGEFFIYNKNIYISGKYMKRAFISYINKCLSDG